MSYLADLMPHREDNELIALPLFSLETNLPDYILLLAQAFPFLAAGRMRISDCSKAAHPNTSKQEKKALGRLIDPRKLSPEAAVHAVHNDRLPVRLVIEVLFSEQSRLSRITKWSCASFSGDRSLALEAPGRFPSKREVLAQQHEARKLREDVARLQNQCRALQDQIDRLGSTEKKKKGIFRWSNFLFRNGEPVDRSIIDDYEVGLERRTPRTPMDGKTARLVHGKGTTPKWRNSLS